MAMLVAPVVAQLSVLLALLPMLAGFAVKAVIAGAEPSPAGGVDNEAELQLVSTAQANKSSTGAQRRMLVEMFPEGQKLLPQDASAEFMRSPFVSVFARF